MGALKEGIKDTDAFDSIVHDQNILCYLYALLANCEGQDAEMKVVSTIKAMAKGNMVSDNILKRLVYRIT